LKAWLGYALVGLVAYIVFLALGFRAVTLVELLAPRLRGFEAEQVQGMAVYGSAQGVRLHGGRVESMSWYADPLTLLQGRAGLHFALAETDLDVVGTLSTDLNKHLYLTGLQGHLPLSKAMALAGRQPLPVSGRIEVDLAEIRLTITGLPQSATGTARLLDAITTVGRPLPLGDFSAELRPRDDAPGIVGTISDMGGPLTLTGQVTLEPSGRYVFSGQAGVRDPNNRPLKQALSLLGRPGRDGQWRIDYAGQLPP